MMNSKMANRIKRPTPAIRVLGSERGAALLLVLWVGTFLSIVLSSFAFSMRTELAAAKNFKEREEAYALARAGITRAIAKMVVAGKRAEASFPTFRLYNPGSVPLGRGTYNVVVTDEGSKISLNHAPPTTLKRLLRYNGVTDLSLLDSIVDSILDWRDPDDFHHLNGAEEKYYRSLSPPYRARNGLFEIVEEFLLVKGMNREILYGNIADQERRAMLREENPGDRVFEPGEYLGIYPFLTVNGSGSVNLNTASLDVLVAVGRTDEEARAIVLRREESPMGGQFSDSSREKQWITTGRAFRIESIGRVGRSPASYRIDATVVNEGGLQRPWYRVIAWHEGPD